MLTGAGGSWSLPARLPVTLKIKSIRSENHDRKGTGGAFDPERGMLYVPSVTAPFNFDLIKLASEMWIRGPGGYVSGPRGLPLVKPPYGRITAIDMNRGEHAWMVPNGDGPRDHELLKELDLPPLVQGG